MDASTDPLAGHESIGGDASGPPIAQSPPVTQGQTDPLAGHASIASEETSPSDFNHAHPILHGLGYLGQELFHGAAQSLSIPHTMSN